ncbi:MAG: hypothetical protein GX905_09775 [Bacteroidales bacterium]|nr:hypothetical protein [Bacteroidales bacterium]
MKTFIFFIITAMLFSSCATIFTKSRQSITFTGKPGTKIYDPTTNIKLGEIDQDETVTISLKKELNDKQLVIKNEGEKSKAVIIESTFNAHTLWNILFWPGFLVDLGTGQMNKYENTIINLAD